MSSLNFSSLVDHIWLGDSVRHSDAEGVSGGIATIWNSSSMTGFELWKDKTVLVTEFQTSRESWGLFNIYAPNNKAGRRKIMRSWKG